MKKILSVVLLTGMLLSAVVIPAFASNDPSADALCEMRSLGEDYYLTAESGRVHGTSGKYFGLNTSPALKTLMAATGSYCNEYMLDYMVRVDGVGHFEIPADLYEAVVFSIFTKNAAILNTLRSSPYYKTDRAKPYYIPDFSDDNMTVLNAIAYYGYKNIGGGNYEVYAYQYGSSNYTPAPGDVLGRDYRGVVGNTGPAYSIYEACGVRYKYIQINGVIRFVFKVGENVTISAAEYLGKSVNPMNDGAIIQWPASVIRNRSLSVDFDTNYLTGEDDYLEIINYTSGDIYQSMKDALGEKAANRIKVLDVTITMNGQKIGWSEEPYTLTLPFGADQYDVYRLNSDGTVAQIPTIPYVYLDAQTGTYFAKPYYEQRVRVNLKGPVTLALVETNSAPCYTAGPTPVIRIEVETTAPPVVTQPPETEPPVTEPPVTEPPEETTEPVSDVVAEEETTDTAEETTNAVKPKKDKTDKSEKEKETKKNTGVVWIIVSVFVVVLGGGAAASYILLKRLKNKRS